MIAALMCGNHLQACDACGGGAASQYIGLLPAFNHNFVGITYTQGGYSGSFASAYHGRPDERVEDTYSSLGLWGRHRIGENYQVFAFVPYQYNVRTSAGFRTESAGLGDISVLFNRVIANTIHGQWRHTAFGGVGVKLPTGAYDREGAHEPGSIPGITPGTGSFDFSANANYTVQHRKTGCNVEIAAALTMPAPDGYKYGNKISSGLTCFHVFLIDRLRISPQLGGRYEFLDADYFNYERGWVNESSGGQLVYAMAGLQLAYSAVGLRTSFLLPAMQQYNGTQIKANYKMEAGFFILF
jgi:hypothetical protein